MKTNKLFYVLSAVLVLGSLAFFGSVSANDNNNRNGEDNGKSEQAKEAHNNGSTLEVHFFDNGKVLVRGAKVTAVTADTVSAFTSWGTVNLNWSVNVMSNSQMFKKTGGSSSISEILVGDFVSFQGNLVATSSSPIVVNASVIKDWTIQQKDTTKNDTKIRTTIEGKLKSLAGTSVPTSIVVTAGDKDYTVNMAADTSILSSSWLKAVLSSFNVGDKVRAYGTVTNLTIDATVVRDTSLLK